MRCNHATWSSVEAKPPAGTCFPPSRIQTADSTLSRPPHPRHTTSTRLREQFPSRTRRLVAWERGNCQREDVYFFINLSTALLSFTINIFQTSSHDQSRFLQFCQVTPCFHHCINYCLTDTTPLDSGLSLSLSRRALVLLLPDGATPVNSFSLSDGV